MSAKDLWEKYKGESVKYPELNKNCAICRMPIMAESMVQIGSMDDLGFWKISFHEMCMLKMEYVLNEKV